MSNPEDRSAENRFWDEVVSHMAPDMSSNEWIEWTQFVAQIIPLYPELSSQTAEGIVGNIVRVYGQGGLMSLHNPFSDTPVIQ